jgi:ubiquinone biosynthesis monooxygenase Coq6
MTVSCLVDHLFLKANQPILHKVWDAVGDGSINFDAEPGGAVSYMIENRVVQTALIAASRSGRQKVDIFNKSQVVSIKDTESGGWPEVTLNDGAVLRGRLLVGADGQNSKVREYAGIKTFGWDYPQRGIVATLRVDESHSNDTSWQRFLPTGPIALLPLARGYSSLVWSAPVDFAQRMTKTLPSEFVAMLNAAFRNPLPDVKFLMSRLQEGSKWDVDLAKEIQWGLERVAGQRTQPWPPEILSVEEGSRALFPLKLRNVDRLVAPRAALIG